MKAVPERILHLVSSLQVGGLEQFAVRMAHFQREAGADAQILTFRDGPLRRETERLGIPVTLLTGGKLKRILAGTARFRRIAPDILHAHNPATLNYGLLGKRACGAPLLLTLHGRGKNDTQAPKSAQWKAVDALVAVSRFVADDWAESSCPIQVILNGVEFSSPRRSRNEVRAELALAADRLVGCVAARMDGLKGQETLLHALSLLPASTPPVTLLLAGDGDRRQEWETLACSLGLTEEQVRFLGFRADVPDLLSASDFFVLPSYSEGLPLSVLEAMSHGLPVIASEVGGVPEVLCSAQEGLLVPPRDPAALADALDTLLQNSELRRRMGVAGAARVKSAFSFDRMMNDYALLYARLNASLWKPST